VERFDESGVFTPLERDVRHRTKGLMLLVKQLCRELFEARLSAIVTRRERSMNEMHERPIVTEANKEAVLQGSTGHHVRYVLIVGCALVIIAFIAIAVFVR
jgi:hypothetical protein